MALNSRKLTYYENLMAFGALVFAHIKKDKLETRPRNVTL